ncbi:MAG: c-type cytochrome [Gammaproteobacteria bacterium]|nr:c-type cytochrome [Gammaproteobacteria bacterium]
MHTMHINKRRALFISLFITLLSLCVATTAQAFEAFQPLPEQPPIPADNRMSAAKAALGQQLFFDPRLSKTKTLSCNSCHNVMAGGTNGLATSVGASGKSGTRSAPTLWNAGFHTILFRDGRALSLEQAITEHLTSPTEMAMDDGAEAEQRIAASAGYRRVFEQVFGGDGALNSINISKALATYIRTLNTPNGPFDRYLNGDSSAISDTAVRGFERFIETGCASCHFWVNLAGPVPGLAFQMGEGFYELFPNYVGSRYDELYQLTKDIGRYLVTGVETDRRMWRVPTLRNVALTAPYFHNGRVKTLDEAVRVMAKVELGKELTQPQVDELVAFLQTLTGEFPLQTMPRLPQ